MHAKLCMCAYSGNAEPIYNNPKSVSCGVFYKMPHRNEPLNPYTEFWNTPKIWSYSSYRFFFMKQSLEMSLLTCVLSSEITP